MKLLLIAFTPLFIDFFEGVLTVLYKNKGRLTPNKENPYVTLKLLSFLPLWKYIFY